MVEVAQKRCKVMITGATGFIGRHLCPALVGTGHDIREIRRTPNADDPDAHIDDLNSKTDWAKALHGVDSVVHLAGRAHVLKETEEDPVRVFTRVNAKATRRLAEQSAEAGVKHFILVSSAGIHGQSTPEYPFAEKDEPQPYDAYTASKWAAEEALLDVCTQTGMPYTIIRPPLVYGAGVKANFYMLLRSVDMQLPLPLGMVKNQRSFVYVKNLVDAVCTSLYNEKAMGQTFLVADDQPHSTPELLRTVAMAMKKKLWLPPVPVFALRLGGRLLNKQGMITRLTESLCVDASHIQRTLDWQPPHRFESGIQATVDWYLQQQTEQN